VLDFHSWFYDSPLSTLGLQQVDDLAAFLSRSNSTNQKRLHDTPSPMEEAFQRHLSILRSDLGAPKSKLVASNLRRAVSTIIGGFQERLVQQQQLPYNNHNIEKILILPSLQEISSNPDTLCITPPHTTIQASCMEQQQQKSARHHQYCNYQHLYNTQTDMSLHTGNKPIRTTNGMKRILEFCDFLCTSGAITEEYIIVGGHSLWFRTFFRLLLPSTTSHIAEEKKMVNGGIVVFDLLLVHVNVGPTSTNTAHNGGVSSYHKYMIDPKSIQIIYGGF
jgi:hypothetical protein